MNKSQLGFIFVLLAGALWGTTGTVTKYIYDYGVEPLSLALLRTSISFVSLYLFAVLTGRRVHLKKKDIPFFLAFGAVSVAAFNLFYLSAIQLTTVSTAVVLLYTAPAFSMLTARLVLKESMTTRKLFALILTFAGIFLVVGAYRPGHVLLNVPGMLAGLGAGLTYGVYSIFTKSAFKRGYGPLETVIVALGSGLVFLLFARPPWHLLPLLSEPLALWLLVVIMAVFSTMLAYLFFATGLVHVAAGKATLVAAVEPVVAIVVAIIFLGETMNLLQFIGVVAVLAAVLSQKS
ncbi:MAG: DMT family transporter [Firmicutes bacterium]|nr:DMT family transporter [Bacillota bacterium]MCL5994357.1 DMT family transporter [Bacillota bacterium]